MAGISKKLTTFEKDVLLKIQNDQRKRYGLRPLKNLRIENIIHITNETNEEQHTQDQQQYEEMYQ